MRNNHELQRIAMLSVHTSPLEQPGSGDAGGLNVYVVETARGLVRRGIDVEIFTRATTRHQAPIVQMEDGIVVRHIQAGPFGGLSKDDLPSQLCAFTAGVLRAEAGHEQGWYDIIHSHYWLSGLVGWMAADRWWVPQVHTMHTLGKVKNLSLAADDQPEPVGRIAGEEQVVDASDMLLANSSTEARELIDLYGANPEQVQVVYPGVDLELFTVGHETRAESQRLARAHLGLSQEALIALFVGRIQPLKAPDVLVKATAALLRRRPELRGRLVVPILGGLSGSGLRDPEALTGLIRDLGLADVVRILPPVSRPELVQWYRAANLLAVPSHNESFGLVAVEAQACGTPVVAANVGGLPTAAPHDVGAQLVDGHDPEQWSYAIERTLLDQDLQRRLSAGAVQHASTLGWDTTIEHTLQAYAKAQQFRRESLAANFMPDITQLTGAHIP